MLSRAITYEDDFLSPEGLSQNKSVMKNREWHPKYEKKTGVQF